MQTIEHERKKKANIDFMGKRKAKKSNHDIKRIDSSTKTASMLEDLNEKWESIANICLYSFVDDDGSRIFTSTRDERIKYGAGRENTFKEYSVFAPDDIIHRVAGKIGKCKDKREKLIAYIDGSYSFAEDEGCAAYSVFFQVRDRIAEYANTVYDETRRYGATAAELLAAVVAIKVAIAFGYGEIELRHDYTGVAFFANDSNAAPNKRSKMYWMFEQYQAFLRCAEKKISISYHKVKSHSLDVGNEHADFLARTYSRLGRRSLDKKRNDSVRRALDVTSQMAAFARVHEIEDLTFDRVEKLMTERKYQDFFALTSIEVQVVCKMLRECGTDDMLASFDMSRRELSELRRSITKKLGMDANSTSDNTIVKKTLSWLYLND